MDLAWVEKIKYLGGYIICGKSFTVDEGTTWRNFLASVNGILSKCPKTSDISKIVLIETHCLHILMYALESINLSTRHCNEINSRWNPVYRKKINFNKWTPLAN